MRVSDLAACVELDASTVSRQIKQLEDKGIVERTADPADGRASLVRLTDDGRETMHRRLPPPVRPHQDRARAVERRRPRGSSQSLLTRLATDLRDAKTATPTIGRETTHRPSHQTTRTHHDDPRPIPPTPRATCRTARSWSSWAA